MSLHTRTELAGQAYRSKSCLLIIKASVSEFITLTLRTGYAGGNGQCGLGPHQSDGEGWPARLRSMPHLQPSWTGAQVLEQGNQRTRALGS